MAVPLTARRRMALWLSVCSLAFALPAWAEGRFIDIAPKTEQDIQLVLDTLEASLQDQSEELPAIVMMLHGPQAHKFLRTNYKANKALVDQTAKLAAYNVIKVQICETWLRKNDFATSELFPFISTVVFGAGELDRLASEEGYTEFSVNI